MRIMLNSLAWLLHCLQKEALIINDSHSMRWIRKEPLSPLKKLVIEKVGILFLKARFRYLQQNIKSYADFYHDFDPN